jgi:hypothetical protein
LREPGEKEFEAVVEREKPSPGSMVMYMSVIRHRNPDINVREKK